MFQNIYSALDQAISNFDKKKTWFQQNFDPANGDAKSLWWQEAFNGIAAAIGVGAAIFGGPELAVAGILAAGIASGVNTYLSENSTPDTSLDNIAAMEL
jgi:hypothetical protein